MFKFIGFYQNFMVQSLYNNLMSYSPVVQLSTQVTLSFESQYYRH
jgi:hypothetical protein